LSNYLKICKEGWNSGNNKWHCLRRNTIFR